MMTNVDVGDRDRAKRIFEILSASEIKLPETEIGSVELYLFFDNMLAQLEGDWRVIDYEWSNGFPTKYWEIDREGNIRHAQSKTILQPKWDFDKSRYIVELQHKEQRMYVYGPGLARTIFEKE